MHTSLKALCLSVIILIVGTSLWAVAWAFPTNDADLISMKDVLNADGLGNTVFSPTGRAFAVARLIPYVKQPDWGYGFRRLVRSQVFVATDAGQKLKSIVNTSDVHYSLPIDPWSPTGSELLLLATTREGYGLAAYNLSTGDTVRLPGYLRRVFPVLDWTSNGRIVYYAVPKGFHQDGNRFQALQTAESRWRAAWYKGKAQVTVSSNSPVMATSEPPVGSLMLADPRTGVATTLARGHYYAINVSPNDRYVAVVRATRVVPAEIDGHTHNGELVIYELSSNGKARLLYKYRNVDASSSCSGGNAISWSPSGERLLFVGAKLPSLDANIYEVDVRSGRIHKIVSPGLSFKDPRSWTSTLQTGWLGDEPVAVAVHARKRKHSRGTQMTNGRGETFQYGGAHNLRYDVYTFNSGHWINLTSFAKASVSRFLAPLNEDYALVIANGALWSVAPHERRVQLSPRSGPAIIGYGIDDRMYPPGLSSTFYRGITDKSRISLYAVRRDGKPKRFLLNLKTHHMSPVNARGTIIATAPNQLTTLSRVHNGWSSSLVLNRRHDHTVLMKFNSALTDKRIAAVKHFDFAYGGKTLNGWVVLPPGARLKSSPPPAIVLVYGGTVYGADSPPFRTKPTVTAVLPSLDGQLLAAQGYAVILPSTPLGRGSSTNLMKTLAGEAVASVTALSMKGMIDPNRVGVIGHSFGGYSVASILAEASSHFKAGVAMAGVYDWIFGYGMPPMATIMSNNGNIYQNGEIKMIEDGQSGLGHPFWQAPGAYVRNSPIFRVDDINAPLLLLNGDINMGVTGIPSAERMYNAMRRANKTVALVRYWGEGHVPKSAGAIQDKWSRIKTWFGYYVKDASNTKKH